MRLIITRHGETEWNIEKRVQGHTPGKLTKKGISQAEKLAERLKDERIDAIYSSDLARAADTAKIIAKYHDCPIEFTQELRERDYGSVTGKLASEIDWDNLPDDVETDEESAIRMKQFVDKLYEQHKDDTVLLVSHGRISKALLSVITGTEVERLLNTSISIIEIEEEGHTIHVINSIHHLYPSREEIFRWYEEEGTPDNIIAHVKQVNRIANFLAARVPVDKELVDKASLLHDLDKWRCINDKSLKHGFETEKMLTEKGFPGLGFYARQHRTDMVLEGLKSMEEKIINYADRRVLHSDIVPMEKRFEYIQKKYPDQDDERWDEMVRIFYDIEEEIFSYLDFPPELLAEKISASEN